MEDLTQNPPAPLSGDKPAEAAPTPGNDFTDVQSGSSTHAVEPKPKPGFWHRVFNTVGRATTGAVDELSNTVVNLGADMAKAGADAPQPKIPGFIDRLTGGSDLPAKGDQAKNRQSFLD